MGKSAYQIRTAISSDLDSLPQIEQEAARQLGDFPAKLARSTACFDTVNSIETFREGMELGRLWVAVDADNRPVGFALAMEIDGNAHLEEIDVRPSLQKRGIGRALVQTVYQWAKENRYSTLTLSTFSPVPWNRPFYERLGFETLPESGLTPGYHRIREHERTSGLNTALRVIMRRRLE